MAGYEENYPRTAVGTVEIKQLPASTVMSAAAPGDAFSDRGAAFMQLFRYISANQVAMTVPVEADARTNRMRFFVGEKDRQRKLPGTADVVVEEIPARTVVSVGIRGGYTRKNFTAGVTRLREWLQQHPEWQEIAEPYGVYWNSPFVPFFLRRSEIHLPVRSRQT